MLSSQIKAEEFIQRNEALNLNAKEALLIIPGFNKAFHGTKKLEEFYSNKGYDLFIFDFKGRYTLEENQKKLEIFYNQNKLNQYHSLHILSYIVGAWILNPVIKILPHANLKTIIYDRSPLQESLRDLLFYLPESFNDSVLAGIIRDFIYTDYTPVSFRGVNVGIIIENRPTKAAKFFENKIKELGPLNFSPDQFLQKYKDYYYIWANHDDMYTRYDGIVPEVFRFMKRGHFSNNVMRKPVDADPFTFEEKLPDDQN